MLDRSVLEHLYPTASDETLTAFADQNEALFAKFGISDRQNRLHFFLAQIGHESGGLRIREENMSYSAKRMREVWPKRFPTAASTDGYVHNPRALANKVYNGRMGNVDGTDDGYNFRGRGFLQVTGRDGYDQISTRTGLDATGNPSIVNDPAHALHCACAMWDWKKCNAPSDAGDFIGVTRKINGGTVGMQDRYAWLAKVQNVVPWPSAGSSTGGTNAEVYLPVTRVKSVQIKLQSLGLYAGSIDGIFGKLSRSALRSFQAEHGLTGNGRITEETLAFMGV